jgi:phytoene synthase
MPDGSELTKSYQYCRAIARAAARNFYYGFLLLPAEKRDALCALYAFMRHADDLADSDGREANKKDRLKAWTAALDRAMDGSYGESQVLPALHHTVKRYGIPLAYFHDLMEGAEMDLSLTTYPSFEGLERYCYCVAGTVGLCCVHVFGFDDVRALELASRLGTAFQLTNILRDVPEDYGMGRVYLPQEDLVRFGCTSDDLATRVAGKKVKELIRFEVNRAWQYYAAGTPLLTLIRPDSRAALWTLIRIYSGILQKIEAIHYDVLASPRPRLSAPEKAWIMLRAGLGFCKPEVCLPRM